MRHGLITGVIKRQILTNNDLTMMSRSRTSDLESTILKNIGLVILHLWSKFYTRWQQGKILLDIITTTEHSLRCIRKWIALEQKDTYHLTVIWVTCYGVDYWETKFPLCEVFTVAFVLWILCGILRALLWITSSA
jgi:hypothetical protein